MFHFAAQPDNGRTCETFKAYNTVQTHLILSGFVKMWQLNSLSGLNEVMFLGSNAKFKGEHHV